EGRLDDAEDVLVTAHDGVTTTNWDRLRTAEALGFVALSRGDPVTAARHLDRWYAVLTAMRLGEPGYSRSYLDYLEGQVASSGRRSAGAIATTGRAMVAAARGQMPQAVATIEQACRWYD